MPIINSTFTSKVRNPGGATLLDYLSRRFNYHSRNQWAQLLSQDRLEIEGRPGRAEDSLREGQRLLFHVVDYDEPEVPLDWRILTPEGPGPHPEDLLFVHKPAGMPVHRTGKIFFQTLANLVKEYLGDPAWSPLNRLDRETSGIVAFARGPKAFWNYAPANPEAKWTKLYLAVVRGVPLGEGVRKIDQPLGELEGDVIRSRMHVHPGGKPSVTLYQTLEKHAHTSLVAVAPLTGRKHQIRAHLAWAGFPIVGDKIYSGNGNAYLTRLDRDLTKEEISELGAPRHLLHCFFTRVGSNSSGESSTLDLPRAGTFEESFGAECLDWTSLVKQFAPLIDRV